jgi:hypothetical protein
VQSGSGPASGPARRFVQRLNRLNRLASSG